MVKGAYKLKTQKIIGGSRYAKNAGDNAENRLE